MVVDGDADLCQCRRHLPCRLDVRPGGRRVAARVVVDQNDGAGAQLERPLDHLARVERGLVDRAAALDLVADQAILAIEEQDPDMLGRFVPHRQLQVSAQRLR